MNIEELVTQFKTTEQLEKWYMNNVQTTQDEYEERVRKLQNDLKGAANAGEALQMYAMSQTESLMYIAKTLNNIWIEVQAARLQEAIWQNEDDEEETENENE